MLLLHLVLEGFPELLVTNWTFIWEPDAYDVVDEVAVEEYIALPVGNKGVFI